MKARFWCSIGSGIAIIAACPMATLAVEPTGTTAMPSQVIAPEIFASVGPVAEKKNSEKNSAKRKSTESAAQPSTETIVMKLIDRHLPELAPMLARLRDRDVKQYNRAIAELARWSRRLEAAQKRDAKLYEIEVQLLKAESEVNLLTARLTVRDDSADREKLKKASARLQQIKLLRAQYDVDIGVARLSRAERLLTVATERLESLQSSIGDDPETTYSRQLQKAGRKP